MSAHRRRDDGQPQPERDRDDVVGLLSGDLITPGLGWPLGERARLRRARRRAIRDLAQRRREQAARLDDLDGDVDPSRRWSPVSPRAHRRVLAILGVVVVGVLALAWFVPGGDERPARPVPAAPPPPVAPPPMASPAPAPDPSPGLAPLDPVPPGGVAPIVPPAPSSGPDPASISTSPPPEGPASRDELASPESAAGAWMARWCPYSWQTPYGASQHLAGSAMTAPAAARADPSTDPRGRQSWQQVVDTHASGRCSAPEAAVIPEAPATADQVVAVVRSWRVNTPDTGPAWVDPVEQQRLVARGADGLWRVDAPSEGG